MRLRHATLPLFPSPSTISSPTYRRELIRGLDNPTDGTVSWYICDMHRYVCGSPSDETWFRELQDHYEHVAQMKRDVDASLAAQLSESSEAGPADAFEADPSTK